jgi:catalytic LigB subunit of aromatic ring-opening dioxygenase
VATIVVGAAIPRGPQLFNPASTWAQFGERDRTNPWLFDLNGNFITYDELLSQAPAGIQDKLLPDLWERQHSAARKALERVQDAFEAAHPDIVVVMGDDERELFLDDATRPKLAIFRGAVWPWGEGRATYPVAVDLADWVTEHLKNAGYQPHLIEELPDGRQMPHSFGQIYTNLMRTVRPMVPIMVNIHYAVNQTTPAESYELGRVVRAAVESWPRQARVGVAGNGGLSAGVLREDVDRRMLDSLQKRDLSALKALPYKWIQGPSGEIYNWIGAAGALEGLEMHLVDYIPAYRSPAGTGCGMAFAVWS